MSDSESYRLVSVLLKQVISDLAVERGNWHIRGVPEPHSYTASVLIMKKKPSCTLPAAAWKL